MNAESNVSTNPQPSRNLRIAVEYREVIRKESK